MVRHSSLGRRAAAGSLAVAALTVGLGGAASAAPAGPAAGGGCVEYTDLVERVVDMKYEDIPPAGPSVGEIGRYRDEVVDASGHVVAKVTGTGRVFYQDPATGHLFNFYTDHIRFKGGGTADSTSVVDINELLQGKRVGGPLIGTGGRFRGWYGTRTWIVKSQDLALVTMRLCPFRR